jgi:hypothetical protein
MICGPQMCFEMWNTYCNEQGIHISVNNLDGYKVQSLTTMLGHHNI